MRYELPIQAAQPSLWRGVVDVLRQWRNLDKALPVLVREIRAEARRPANFWLRIFAPAVLMAVFCVTMLNGGYAPSMTGMITFDALTKVLLWATWIFAPIITADCLSKEKREGTLPLLFLTPLTVMHVILGKAAIHILRLTTLLVAALPIMLLPSMLGAVAASQMLWAVVCVIAALLTGIGAGICASAKGGTTIQVMVLSEIHALVFYVCSGMASFILGLLFGRMPWAGTVRVIDALMIAVAFFLFSLWLSKRRLQKNWSRDTAAPEQPRWVKLFSTSEFWQLVFHWNRGKALDRNPIAWLQEYSWTARLTKWGWFITMFFAEFFVLCGAPLSQDGLTTALSLGVAFSAANSFRRERQTGMLEILLVTPVSARRIIGGRLWGLCAHFIPALAIMGLFAYAIFILNPKQFTGTSLMTVMPNPLVFVGLIVTGLYVSLWRMNFFLGWLVTWLLAFVAPYILVRQFELYFQTQSAAILVTISIYEIILSAICLYLLQQNIRTRRFLEGLKPA